MRKFFWCGTFLTLAAMTAVYWAGVYAGRHPESVLGLCTGIVYQGAGCLRGCQGDSANLDYDEASAPEEPQPVVDALPDQPEPIVLDKNTPPLQLEVFSAPPVPVSGAEMVLPTMIDGEDDGFKTMPPCADEEPNVPEVMPYATEEDQAGKPTVQPTAVSKPSTMLLRPNHEEGGLWPKVDTTEFRPTDAKRGEFGRIPF
jgi:hypothetical protein